MPDVLTVLTTLDDLERALALARGACERRLAACAQVGGPLTSVYRWQGEVREDEEWRIELKTSAARYPALEEWLRGAHPYDVPEIVATPVVRGSAAYLRWVTEECEGPYPRTAAT